ncbi:MAG: pyridoxamine 5'-phosphate oxidase family protein [Caulobacteraceae bacterium]
MSTDTRNDAETEKRLWDEIEGGGAGMLGVVGSGDHFQPMTPYLNREAGRIWFFVKKDADLVRTVGEGRDAMFIVQHGQKFDACIAGRLVENLDTDARDAHWNKVVEAWFPEGKTDPTLTMLRFDCRDAQLWISEGGPLKFGWEIAKANVTGKEPDVGERTSLSLN